MNDTNWDLLSLGAAFMQHLAFIEVTMPTAPDGNSSSRMKTIAGLAENICRRNGFVGTASESHFTILSRPDPDTIIRSDDPLATGPAAKYAFMIMGVACSDEKITRPSVKCSDLARPVSEDAHAAALQGNPFDRIEVELKRACTQTFNISERKINVEVTDPKTESEKHFRRRTLSDALRR